MMTTVNTGTAMATTITTEAGMLPLLQLLQLASPSLPIGGFAWSQGLEAAIEQGWLKNEGDFSAWVDGVLQHSFRWQEIPLLKRLHAAAEQQDLVTLQCWNRTGLALRESAELYQEDTQMGAALLRLMRDLEFPFAREWNSEPIGYPTAFAIACCHHRIPLLQTAAAFVWSWLENQIAAALKLFPLGQTAGQRVFQKIAPDIEAVIAFAVTVQDSEIGISLPGVVMASMQHEEQYSRLFRS